MVKNKNKDHKFTGMFVEVKGEKNLDFALKKLKRLMKNSGTTIKIQESMYFVKPSEKKRKEKNRAKVRARFETKQNAKWKFVWLF